MKKLLFGIMALTSLSCFAVEDGVYSTTSDSEDVIVVKGAVFKGKKITLEQTRQVGGYGGVSDIELVPYPTVCRTLEMGKIVEESDIYFSYRVKSIKLVESNENDDNCSLYLKKYKQKLKKEVVEYSIYKSELIKKDVEGTGPCGLEGSVDERIKDCSSEAEGFVLVTRSKDFKEVHKEKSTGLLWSDRLPYMSHYNAETACSSNLKEVAGISGFTWRLPSIDEYKEAERNGIRKALPNMDNWFWSSSVHSYDDYNGSGSAWLFDGTGDTYYGSRSSLSWVRCVAH
jgi:hypothetical protein